MQQASAIQHRIDGGVEQREQWKEARVKDDNSANMFMQ
jgi:hypothetical protein